MSDPTFAASTASDNPNHTCRLLNLPAELREYVYRMALVQEESIRVYMYENSPDCPKSNSHYSGTEREIWKCCTQKASHRALEVGLHPLLATCRQIYMEGYKIYWAENVFTCDAVEVGSWLTHIGKDVCKLLSRIEIQFRTCREANRRSPVVAQNRLELIYVFIETAGFQLSKGVVFVDMSPSFEAERLWTNDPLEDAKKYEIAVGSTILCDNGRAVKRSSVVLELSETGQD